MDDSHNPLLQSWVSSANDHVDFPIQNLPLGVFSPEGGAPRAGVAIGDYILDLSAAVARGLLPDSAATLHAHLNAFLDQGVAARQALRAGVSALLAQGSSAAAHAGDILHEAARCVLHLPAAIGDYTDFYAGIHHATAIGALFRPDAPLLPNYKYVPIGYHGRASSVRPSGVAVRRPHGQRKTPDMAAPEYGPCRNLDYELEFGVWIGTGNAAGQPIDIADAHRHIAGYCLLNDWSARDIQAWEYQPLGPFLAKSFATTISPWIVTPEALAPFRIAQAPRPAGDPAPLPYLWNDADQAHGAFDITLEVYLRTERMRAAGLAPHRFSRGNTRHAYWTMAQLVAHHTSNGCDLRAGDLFGSGTLSGPTPDSLGSLMELSRNGQAPLALPNGETRRFLEDGDEVSFCGRASAEGAVGIGFGRCWALVLERGLGK